MVINRNYTKDEAIRIILKAAKDYDKLLCNKRFLVIYKKGDSFVARELFFTGANFCHLTGVKTDLSGKEFYKLCLNNKLSTKQFSLNTGGKAQQKLAVLPYLKNLLCNHCWIGVYNNNGVFLKADYYIGDTKCILSLGFKITQKFDVPMTLLNRPVKEMAMPTYKVYAIYSRSLFHSAYTEPLYTAKDYDISLINHCSFYSLISPSLK